MKIINHPQDSLDLPVQGAIFDMDGMFLDSRAPQYMWLKQAHQTWGDGSTFPENDHAFWDSYNEVYQSEGVPGLYKHIVKTDLHKNEKEIWKAYNQFNKSHPIDLIVTNGFSTGNALSEIFTAGSVSMDRHTRLRIGANTTRSLKSTLPILERHKMLTYFDTIVTFDDIIKYVGDGVFKKNNLSTDDLEAVRKVVTKEAHDFLEKPNSLSSLLTLYRMGVPANSVIAFEDTVNGVKAYKPVLMPLKATPVYVAAVNWGYEDGQKLLDAGADVLLEDTREIIELLDMAQAFK